MITQTNPIAPPVFSRRRPLGASQKRAASANPSVLIWDDDLATAKQLEKVFKMHGCKVRSVNFGNEAFLCFQREEYDLVVMDYQLSLIDARRALEGIPEWVRVSTPFVLISSQDRFNEARELGFSAFYAKPVLVDTAQEILGRFTTYTKPVAPEEPESEVALGFALSARAQQVCGYGL